VLLVSKYKQVSKKINPCFSLGEFVRAKPLFPLSASLITSAKAMPTKEKVASREQISLMEK
jgi:hypothetical protein